MFSKKLLSGAALTALSMTMGAGVAHAQSTGSQAAEEETIVVTGSRTNTIDGTIVAETVAKSRATITEEFIDRQAAGQTILQSVNLIPGVNFTNNDPYGSAGGNLRIRGFDGNRISLTIDGIPLNDTGNYAIYSNQQLDPELISRATVNMGTTDVDSPTASATGGTINYVTRRPTDDPALWLQGSVGEYNFGRLYARADTGAFGPWDTGAFVAGSFTAYDKWKGPGELEKSQINAGIFEEWDDNFIFVGVHYNRNRNDFYRNINLATFNSAPGTENDLQCIRATPQNGVIQNEAGFTGAAAPNTTYNDVITWNGTLVDGATTAGTSCTNYHNLRINPSDTGNIRSQMSFQLAPNLRFTFDPSFQYVIANGGGFSTVSETDDRLDQAGGNGAGPGVDLNGDADVLDTVMLYSPSTTNTRRWGINSSVIWDVNDDHRVRFAYTLDYGTHRQTGDMGFFDSFGNPEDVYGGKDGYGRTVDGLDDSNLRSRNRASVALLNQLAFDYRGYFFDDALTVNLGLRAPMFMRRLNQMCYSQDGSSNVRCTTEAETSVLPNGNVTLSGGGATEYLRPYRATLRFEDILPNVGVNWRFAENNSIYASYAEGLSAPRTDNLYTVSRTTGDPTGIDFSNAEPETTQSIDIGYRYQSGSTIAQIALWQTNYDNRIVSAFDDLLSFFVDRNVGSVEMQGVDAQVGFEPIEGLSLYASASYIESELQDNIPLSATTFLPTAGRALVETPDWTYAMRAEWDVTNFFSVGLQGKYVGDRFSTDVNDQVAPSYTTWDLDARLDLDFIGFDNAMIQFNVINVFDEEYLGGISSQNNALTVDVDPGPGVINRAGSQPTYALGAPRTALVTLRTTF